MRRDKAAFPSGCKSHPATAPARRLRSRTSERGRYCRKLWRSRASVIERINRRSWCFAIDSSRCLRSYCRHARKLYHLPTALRRFYLWEKSGLVRWQYARFMHCACPVDNRFCPTVLEFHDAIVVYSRDTTGSRRVSRPVTDNNGLVLYTTLRQSFLSNSEA